MRVHFKFEELFLQSQMSLKKSYCLSIIHREPKSLYAKKAQS